MKTNLKCYSSFLLLGITMLLPINTSAQLTKDQIKERAEVLKSSKKELNEKATKAARKEAKKMEKEGWTVTPGALPLEKQLDRSYTMQMEYGSDRFPVYIMSEGMSIGGSYDSAKLQALELAKQNLASQIGSEVAALVENSVANGQLGQEEASSLVNTLSNSQSLIVNSLESVITVVEVYRTLPNRNKEVLIRIAYSGEMARKAALKAAGAGNEGDFESTHEALKQILSSKHK